MHSTGLYVPYDRVSLWLSRFHWTYKKALEFIEAKRKGGPVPQYFKEELKALQSICLSGYLWNLSTTWNFVGKKTEETIVANTFINSRKTEVNTGVVFRESTSLFVKSKNKKKPRVEWNIEELENLQTVSDPLDPAKLKLCLVIDNLEVPKSILSSGKKKENNKIISQSNNSLSIQISSTIISGSISPLHSPTRNFSISNLPKTYFGKDGKKSFAAWKVTRKLSSFKK